MKYSSIISSWEKREKSDLVCVPFWQQDEKAVIAAHLQEVTTWVKPLLSTDFSGKNGEIAYFYPTSTLDARLLLLGLGNRNTSTTGILREAYADAIRSALAKKCSNVTIVVPEEMDEQQLQAIAEGVLLSNYSYTLQEKKGCLLEKITWITQNQAYEKIVTSTQAIIESVHVARDLINGNADTITPKKLVEESLLLAQRYPSISVEILDKQRLEKEKMGLILAVGQGAAYDPAMIIIRYRPNQSKDHTILVGKGVTFDTGGLNLKPTNFIETMKSDMSGAATVLAVMQGLAALNLPVTVTGIIPTVENAIDAKSYKPGDVYTSYQGLTVEITNTDAEGRLILADALAYACKHLSPTRMIDLATLTGAITIALGDSLAGLFVNDDTLSQQLMDASAQTQELLWRLPLYEPYLEDMRSDIADLRNSGDKRGAGSIKGALFLQQFVDSVPWAHLDIASTAYSSTAKGSIPKHGVGFGVRLLLRLLHNLSINKK